MNGCQTRVLVLRLGRLRLSAKVLGSIPVMSERYEFLLYQYRYIFWIQVMDTGHLDPKQSE